MPKPLQRRPVVYDPDTRNFWYRNAENTDWLEVPMGTPPVGMYRVTAIYVNANGKLVVEYDDGV